MHFAFLLHYANINYILFPCVVKLFHYECKQNLKISPLNEQRMLTIHSNDYKIKNKSKIKNKKKQIKTKQNK